MKNLALVAIAAMFSAVFQAQGQTSASASATASTRILAEFNKKVDTKDARVGDEVLAKVSVDAGLADGTVLTRGTHLIGTVIEVRAKSNADKTAHLAFRFDKAMLPDGHEVRLHATLTSMSAPVPITAMDTPTPGAGTGAAMAGRPSTKVSGSVVDMGTDPGSTVGSGAGQRGRSGGGSGDTINRVAADAAAETAAMKVVGLDDPRAEGASANGTYVSDALRVHRYAVGNMPGVILSSLATANVSGVLDANGQNIRIEGGTKMTMNATVVAR